MGTIKVAYWIKFICCLDVFLWCVLYDSFSCNPRGVKRTLEQIQKINIKTWFRAVLSYLKYKALVLQSASIVWYWCEETQCNGFDIACSQQGGNKWNERDWKKPSYTGVHPSQSAHWVLWDLLWMAMPLSKELIKRRRFYMCRSVIWTHNLFRSRLGVQHDLEILLWSKSLRRPGSNPVWNTLLDS